MLGTIHGLGRLEYGTIYAVPVTYLYLIASNAFVFVPYIGHLDPVNHGIALLLLSLYGAFWLHHMSLLIFGNRAGMQSTKESSVMFAHILYFATGVQPDRYEDEDTMISMTGAALRSGEVNYKLGLRFLPAAFFHLYSLIGWVWLSFLAVEGQGTIVSAVLWLILSILLFQKRVVGYLPDYIPSESVEGINVPEYIRVRQEIERNQGPDSNPRIKSGSPGKSQPKIR